MLLIFPDNSYCQLVVVLHVQPQVDWAMKINNLLIYKCLLLIFLSLGFWLKLLRQVVFKEVLVGTKIPGCRGRWRLYLTPHCHHQNDSCIKMGSDESHFNVFSNCEGQSHKTVSTNHNLFEEKGEPKWNRTGSFRLTA